MIPDREIVHDLEEMLGDFIGTNEFPEVSAGCRIILIGRLGQLQSKLIDEERAKPMWSRLESDPREQFTGYEGRIQEPQ